MEFRQYPAVCRNPWVPPTTSPLVVMGHGSWHYPDPLIRTQECYNIFSSGGAEHLSGMINAPFLGRVPIDPALARASEQGENYLESCEGSAAFAAVENVVQKLVEQVEATP